jgi:hypothetical protein
MATPAASHKFSAEKHAESRLEPGLRPDLGLRYLLIPRFSTPGAHLAQPTVLIKDTSTPGR